MEEWRSLSFLGFPNYEVSDLGNIRSSRGMRQLSVNNHGYLVVTLVCGHNRQTFQVHRLVALAFIPNPNKLPTVNHKNENPLNCCKTNLEWCTQIYNIQYSQLGQSEILSNSDKVWIRTHYNTGNPRWTLKLIAERFHCSIGIIHKVIHS